MKIKWVDVWEAIKVPSILATVVVVLPPICHNITCSSSHQWPISPSPSCALHVTAGLSSSLIHALSGCSPLLWYVSQPFSASGHAVVHASQVNLSLLHHDFALQLLEATKKPGNLHLTRLPRLHIWPTLSSCWGSHEFCICQLRASTSRTQVLSCFLQSPSFSELLDQKHRIHLSFSWPALSASVSSQAPHVALKALHGLSLLTAPVLPSELSPPGFFVFFYAVYVNVSLAVLSAWNVILLFSLLRIPCWLPPFYLPIVSSELIFSREFS